MQEVGGSIPPGSTKIEENAPDSVTYWSGAFFYSDWLRSALATLGYVLKFVTVITNEIHSQKSADDFSARSRGLWSAVHGATFNPDSPKTGQYDPHATIREWVLFIDRMGFEYMTYSIETVHAQKWYSQSELLFFKENEHFEFLNGHSRIEVHRKKGTDDKVVPAHIRHMVKYRRSRPLVIDTDWMCQTDKPDRGRGIFNLSS